MDIQMPEMDGITATREIRKGLEGTLNPDIPILALTANVMPGNTEHYLRVGMNDSITKPIDQTELLTKLKTWASKHRSSTPVPVEEVLEQKDPQVQVSAKVIDFEGCWHGWSTTLPWRYACSRKCKKGSTPTWPRSKPP
jgi:DNA-binding response OmpR family regulator